MFPWRVLQKHTKKVEGKNIGRIGALSDIFLMYFGFPNVIAISHSSVSMKLIFRLQNSRGVNFNNKQIMASVRLGLYLASSQEPVYLLLISDCEYGLSFTKHHTCISVTFFFLSALQTKFIMVVCFFFCCYFPHGQ